MSFAFPWALWLLPLTLWLLRKNPARALTLSSLSGWRDTPPPRRIRWLVLLRLLNTLAAALLVVAMAGPRMERPITEEMRQGIAIQLLMDISSSMDRHITGAAGEKKSRLEQSKAVVEAFIAHRPNDLIGLITFARYADTLSPLTFGHEALIQLVRGLVIQDRPNEDGTAYGDALSLACARLRQIDEWRTDGILAPDDPAAHVQSKIVVLLTDGENNCGLHLPQESAGLAKKWGFRIYAISLGDAVEVTGASIAGSERTDAEKLLERIAEETGAAFWKIYDAEGLRDAYAEIDRLEKSKITSATLVRTEYAPVFAWLALPALCLWLLERLLACTVLRVAEEADA